MKDIEYQHVLFNYPLPFDIKHSATLEPVLRYMYNRIFLQAGTAVDESHCRWLVFISLISDSLHLVL